MPVNPLTCRLASQLDHGWLTRARISLFHFKEISRHNAGPVSAMSAHYQTNTVETVQYRNVTCTA